ncbi:MAG TPA: DUF3592 domain-containing protein, partial [Bradyrhizobium sp.]|nr:DUF3592 domain-containing protein [Bradyrhizobium sp.]
MTDLTVANSTQQMRASGFAAVLGLFAGLCAIFSGCVTLSDWVGERAQARWPIVSAVVEWADVVSVRPAKAGGGTEWMLRYRVHYDLDGETAAATLTSGKVASDSEAATLRSWAAQHRNGSHIDIRYDPSQQNRAAFASPELPSIASRTGTDGILFAIAALACAGFVSLARYLKGREAAGLPIAQGQRRMLVFASLFVAMGLMAVGLAINGAIHADPFKADNLMGVPAGLMFVFAGVLIGLPPEAVRWRAWLGTLVVTCFALTFDWVAFGPGERKFTGNIVGIGFVPSELMGRIGFGFFAVVLDVWAA